MSDPYVYDKAKYHMTGSKTSAPTWELASGPALFILRWCMDRELVSSFFLDESGHSLPRYRSGNLSLFDLYEKEWDMTLISDMLSDEGNAFGQIYFDYSHGRYIEDLLGCLGLNKREYPLYSEEAYLRVKPLLDSRYAEWKAGNLESLRQPPAKQGRKTMKPIAGVIIVIVMVLAVYLIIHLL